MFRLYSDSRVWTHLPSGRHTTPERSRSVIGRAATSWAEAGLGGWALRDRASGRFAGTAGVDLTELGVWNLGYRIEPDYQGRGLSVAVSRLAVRRATELRPLVPVVARMLDRNPGSIAVAERVGLRLVWHGDSAAEDGSARGRRIYADRALAAALVERLVALG